MKENRIEKISINILNKHARRIKQKIRYYLNSNILILMKIIMFSLVKLNN